MSRKYKEVQEKLTPAMRGLESVGEALEVAAENWEDEQYMTYAPTGDTYTYSELDNRVNTFANALEKIGVSAGDRVGLYLTNGPIFVEAIFSSMKLGAIETPINWQFQKREVTHAIEAAGISTVIVEADDGMLDVLTSAIPETDVVDNVVVTEDYRFGELNELDGVDIYLLPEIRDDASATAPERTINSEDPSAILYTSGTTGLPKPSSISHKSLLLAAKSMLGSPLSDEDVNYNPYPLFHTNNQAYSMLASIIHGSQYVLSDTFSASKFWDEVTENNVTSFNLIGGVPKILDSQYESNEIPENDLELAIGPIATELWEKFEEKFGLTVIQIYSQTESPTLLMNHPDPDKIKVGALGQPMFPDLGHEAWILDDDGTELGPGNKGELIRDDPGSMIGYWEQPEKTKETLRDGNTHSGDIVRMDKDRYFYYVDRKKFMVRRSGENIAAQEVENVIDELDGVSESAIIPVPDEIRGEEVKTMVIRTEEGLSEKDIILKVGDTLAPYKVPRFVEFVDEFPRTPTERIQRVKLADREKDRDDHGWDRKEEFTNWKDEV